MELTAVGLLAKKETNETNKTQEQPSKLLTGKSGPGAHGLVVWGILPSWGGVFCH